MPSKAAAMLREEVDLHRLVLNEAIDEACVLWAQDEPEEAEKYASFCDAVLRAKAEVFAALMVAEYHR